VCLSWTSPGINRNDKPIAVVISAAEYTRLEALKEAHPEKTIEEGIADLQTGKVRKGKTVIDDLRKRINRQAVTIPRPHYQFTARVKHDLEGIIDYTVQQWGASQADAYLDGLEARTQLLAENPDPGGQA